MLGGQALIDHVATALRAQTDALVIVGRDWPGLVRVADAPRAGLGPLGGLCGALLHARTIGADAVLSLGCDTLPVPADLAARLAPGPAVVEDQRLIGLWPAGLAPRLAAWIEQAPSLSIRAWMDECGARAEPLAEQFFNINTPDDLARLAAYKPSSA